MTTAHPPAPPRNAEEQRLVEDALVELYEQRITFNQTLGLKVVRLFGPDGPAMRLDMRPDLIGHYLYGRLHGGAISATLDAMGSLGVLVELARKHAEESAEQFMHRFTRLGTIDLRVDYLRQGIGRHFIATAEVTRLGGRVGSTQMRLVNDEGMLIATGSAAYMLS